MFFYTGGTFEVCQFDSICGQRQLFLSKEQSSLHVRPSGIECDQQIDVDNSLSTDLKICVVFFFLNSKHLSEDVSSSQLEWVFACPYC